VAAIGVGVAFLAMTTLLPALLSSAGAGSSGSSSLAIARARPTRDVAGDHRSWARVAGIGGRRPRAIWVGTASVLAVLMLGVSNLSLGLPGSEASRKTSAR
jgi:RND superfamily putative drug exporter